MLPLALLYLAAISCCRAKIVMHHLDRQENYGETMLYAISASVPHNTDLQNALNSIGKCDHMLGLYRDVRRRPALSAREVRMEPQLIIIGMTRKCQD